MWLSSLVDQVLAPGAAWFPVLLDAAVKGVVVLMLAGAATLMMRRSSAASRHLVWFLGTLSLLILPILSATLPGWYILPRLLPYDAMPAQPPPSVAVAPAPDPFDVRTPGWEEEPFAQEAPAAMPVAPPAAVPLPQAPAPSPLRLPWQAWSVLAWLSGSVFLLGYIVLGYLSLWWLQRRSSHLAQGPWPILLRQVSAQLDLRRPVELFVSPRRAMPMTWGLWRICLLLPEESADWQPDQYRAVLLHELAHAKRWDCLTQLVAQIACALHWFNPLVWVAWRRMQTERERACDDLVLSTGAKASTYAEQLLHIASDMPTARFSAAAIAMARPSKLEGRLLAILDVRRSRKAVNRLGFVLGAIALLGVALPLAMLRAESRQAPLPTASVGSREEGVRPEHPAADQPSTRPAAIAPMTTAQVAEYHRALTGESLSHDALKKYYTDLALTTASSGGDPHELEKAIGRALAFEQDEATLLQLYVYLGDAHWRQTHNHTPEVWGPQRRKAAEVYLTGLAIVLRYDLPAEPPALPAINKYDVDGSPEVVEKYRQQHAREMAARQEAERLDRLVHFRQALTGQVIQMYAREPDDFEQLHQLALEYLGSEQAAAELEAGAKAYRAAPQAPPVILTARPASRPATLPSPARGSDEPFHESHHVYEWDGHDHLSARVAAGSYELGRLVEIGSSAGMILRHTLRGVEHRVRVGDSAEHWTIGRVVNTRVVSGVTEEQLVFDGVSIDTPTQAAIDLRLPPDANMTRPADKYWKRLGPSELLPLPSPWNYQVEREFAAPIEKTIRAGEEKDWAGLDLDTGAFVSSVDRPEFRGDWSYFHFKVWRLRHGFDLALNLNSLQMLVLRMDRLAALVRLGPEAWSMTPGTLVAHPELRKAEPMVRGDLVPDREIPVTYAFKTIDGSIGLLQIESLPGRLLKVRLKHTNRLRATRSAASPGAQGPNTAAQSSDLNRQAPDSAGLLERLRARDAHYTEDFTLVVDEAETSIRQWPSASQPEKRRRTISLAGSTWGMRSELLDPGLPEYHKTQKDIIGRDVESNDPDGFMIVWRFKQEFTLGEPDFQGTLSVPVLYRIRPDGTVLGPSASRNSLDLWKPSPMPSNRSVVYPLWAAGRGFARHIQTIVESRPIAGGLIQIEAVGRFANKQGNWQITLDPDADDMVRSARFSFGPNAPAILACENSGRRVVRSGLLPQSGTIKLGDLKLDYEFIDWRPVSDKKMLEDLHDKVRGASAKGAQVYDHRLDGPPAASRPAASPATTGPATTSTSTAPMRANAGRPLRRRASLALGLPREA